MITEIVAKLFVFNFFTIYVCSFILLKAFSFILNCSKNGHISSWKQPCCIKILNVKEFVAVLDFKLNPAIGL